MLISFSVANFRSFAEEQTLSMVASKRLGSHHPTHVTPLAGTDHDLLPVAVFYGANGSGKSNWVKAFEFGQRLILEGTNPDAPITRQRFAMDSQMAANPTKLEYRFSAAEGAYVYGFEVTEKEVATEWLSLLDGERERLLFERLTTEGEVKVELGKDLSDAKRGDHRKIEALASIGVRRNQLFLTAIWKNVEGTGQGPLIRPVLEWFNEGVAVVPPDSQYSRLAPTLIHDEEFAGFLGRFLFEAGTGIDGVRTEARELNLGPLGLSPEELAATGTGVDHDSLYSPLLRQGPEVTLMRMPDGRVAQLSIQAEHRATTGEKVVLPFDQESDGTIRLAHLVPALDSLRRRPRVYVIDEIDRSLHPLLARKFLECFLATRCPQGSQLILTTHESNLLDLDLLRRDEIWFAEKSPAGATEIYSLSDFKVRQDLRIQKGYLEGRFGAIPFLGNLDRLMHEGQPA
jgi:AAA15 family ATPase/GTPase